MPADSTNPTLTDSLRYDADSRLSWRREWSAILATLHQETLPYDARDKVTKAEVYVADGNQDEVYDQAYSGLGTLVAALVTSSTANTRFEEWLTISLRGHSRC
jgi:hypothetical protein